MKLRKNARRFFPISSRHVSVRALASLDTCRGTLGLTFESSFFRIFPKSSGNTLEMCSCIPIKRGIWNWEKMLGSNFIPDTWRGLPGCPGSSVTALSIWAWPIGGRLRSFFFFPLCDFNEMKRDFSTRRHGGRFLEFVHFWCAERMSSKN